MTSPKVNVEKYRKGRVHGAIYTVPDGRQAFLARRKIADIDRSIRGCSISDAVRNGTAFWSLNDETLLEMRARGIKFVGVHVRETGDRYLTVIDRFFDTKKAKLFTRGGRNHLWRGLSVREFRLRQGVMKV